MKILLGYPVEERHVEKIRLVAPTHEVVAAAQHELPDLLMESDCFCGHVKVPVNWRAIVDRDRLAWIQSSAAGLDHCLHPAVIESDIVVSSASGVLSDQVAEHALALIGALVRRFPAFHSAQLRRAYNRQPTDDLHGKRIGIVGFGGVGQRVAELLAPYRVEIVATDYFPQSVPSYVKAVWAADALPNLLRQSDIVILCVPLTDVTRGMIGESQIAMMPSGSLLLNVCRGDVLVESALIDALNRGHLSAAAIDVACDEPLKDDNMLWTAPRLMITPHVAGQSNTRIDRMTDFFCENLVRYLNNTELLNTVDKTLGFPPPKKL